MNRVLPFRHPLHALFVSNPTRSIPFSPLFQSFPFTQTLMNSEIYKDKPGVSSLSTFTTFCNFNQDLSTKKCVPCNTKDLRPMTHDAAHTLIQQVAQWNLVNEGDMLKLRRSWKVKTFTKGLEFFRRIADLAEAEGHHPDLHLVGWNNVTIEIWTHAVDNFVVETSGTLLGIIHVIFIQVDIHVHVGGLTENDFILAAKIDGLNLHDLLRRSD